VNDAEGEHVVLSDGRRRIRIDIIEGSLATPRPVVLHYRLSGIASIRSPLATLGKLIGIVKHARFAPDRHPSDQGIARHLLTLRVSDALASGATQSEIAETLFGKGHPDSADSLRSRTRRLIREARRMARGGWRTMLRHRDR